MNRKLLGFIIVSLVKIPVFGGTFEPTADNRIVNREVYKQCKYSTFYLPEHAEAFSKAQWLLSNPITEKKGLELAQRMTTEYDKFHPRAHKLLASYFIEKQDFDQAIPHLRTLAENADDPDAQRILGTLLLSTNEKKVKRAAIELINLAAMPRAIKVDGKEKYYVDWKAQLARAQFCGKKENETLFIEIMRYGRPFLGDTWLRDIYFSPLFKQSIETSENQKVVAWRDYVQYEAFKGGLHSDEKKIRTFLEECTNPTYEMNVQLGEIYQKENDEKNLFSFAERLIDLGDHQDHKLGLGYLHYLADQHNAQAQTKLIDIYLGLCGKKNEQDVAKALSYLNRMSNPFSHFCERELEEHFDRLIEHEKNVEVQFEYGKFLIENAWLDDLRVNERYQKGVDYITKVAQNFPQAYWYLADQAFISNNLTSANEYLKNACDHAEKLNSIHKPLIESVISSAKVCAEDDGPTAFVLSQIYKFGVHDWISKDNDLSEKYRQLAVKLGDRSARLQEIAATGKLTINSSFDVLNYTSMFVLSEEMTELRKNAWELLEKHALTDNEARAALVVSLLRFHNECDTKKTSQKFDSACSHFQEIVNYSKSHSDESELSKLAFTSFESLRETFPAQVCPLIAQYRLNIANDKALHNDSVDYANNMAAIQYEINQMQNYQIPCKHIVEEMIALLMRDAENFYKQGKNENAYGVAEYAALNLNHQPAQFWMDISSIGIEKSLQMREIVAHTLCASVLTENDSKKAFFVGRELSHLGIFAEIMRNMTPEACEIFKELLYREVQFNPIESLLILAAGKIKECWKTTKDLQFDPRSIDDRTQRDFATYLIHYVKDELQEIALPSCGAQLSLPSEYCPFIALQCLKEGKHDAAVNYCSSFLDALEKKLVGYNSFVQNELLEKTIYCLGRIDNDPKAFDCYLSGCEVLIERLKDPIELLRFADVIADCLNETGVNQIVLRNHYERFIQLFSKSLDIHPAFHALIGDFERDKGKALKETGSVAKNERRKFFDEAIRHYDLALSIQPQFIFSNTYSRDAILKRKCKAYEYYALTFVDGTAITPLMKHYFQQAIQTYPETAGHIVYYANILKAETDENVKTRICNEIVELLEFQAYSGNTNMQLRLGRAYMSGRVLEIPIKGHNFLLEITLDQDAKKAKKFLAMACKNGSVLATKELGELYCAKPGKKKKNIEKSLQYLKKAYAEFSDFALDVAAVLYDQKRYKEAFEWLSKPISEKGRNAMKNVLLATMHLKGQSCDLSMDKYIERFIQVCVDDISDCDLLPSVVRKVEQNELILPTALLMSKAESKDIADYVCTKMSWYKSIVLQDEAKKRQLAVDAVKKLELLQKSNSLCISTASDIDVARIKFKQALQSKDRNEYIRALISLSTAAKKTLKMNADDQINKIMKEQVIKLLQSFTNANSVHQFFTFEEVVNLFNKFFLEFMKNQYIDVAQFVKSPENSDAVKSNVESNNNNNAKK